MPYIIPLLLIILGLVLPKDKWLTILILLYYWALVGLNTFTPDYESYQDKYELFIQLEDYEIGHQGLVLLCNFLGFTYQEFRMVYGLLMAVFAFIAVKRLSPFPNYLLALCLIWPFVGNASGLRQGLANIIVCCGVPCLFKEGKIQIIKYLLWIALAWSIHQSTLFFILLLFARCHIGQRDKLIILIAVGIGTFIIASTQIMGNIPIIADNGVFNKFFNLAGDDTADHQNLAGFMIRAFLVICYAILVPMLSSIIRRHAILTPQQNSRLKICSNISLLLLLSIPGYVVSGEYQRFLYGMLLVYYVVFAEFRFIRFATPYNNRAQMIFASFGLILLTVWYYMFSMRSHDVLATFRDNLLFK